jgi:hypothetical protein
MRLKAIYWNCWTLPKVATDHHMTGVERARIEAPIIAGYDIAILNEAWGNAVKEIFEATHPFHCKTPKLPTRLYDSGLMILSKYPITNVDYHLYEEGSDWDWFTSKGILGCNITLNQRTPLYIITSHMQAGNTKIDGRNRLNQSIELIRFLRSKVTDPYNTFFIGDINMRPVDIAEPTDDDIIREGCLDMIIKHMNPPDTKGLIDILYKDKGLYHMFTGRPESDIVYQYCRSPVNEKTRSRVSDGDYISFEFDV